MEKLYIETKRCLLSINEQLGKFESTFKNDEAESLIKKKIDDLFKEIQANLNQLDIYVTKEPATRKYDSKLKVDQIKYDSQHYKTAYNSMQYKK
jgi:Golgi SNAP receptor complex protein 2